MQRRTKMTHESLKVFINIYRHINSSVLPLRYGCKLSEPHQRFAEIRDAEFDVKATDNQRGDERDKGRKHYKGILSVRNENRSLRNHEFEGQWVLEPPFRDNEYDSVVTGFRPSLENLRGSLSVTRHIDGLLKDNKINSNDIINVLHPLYLEGSIKTSNDVQSVYETQILPGKQNEPIISTGSDDPIVDSGNDIVSTATTLSGDTSSDQTDDDLKMPLRYKQLPLKSVKYEYVLADAFIENAGVEGNKIWVKVINSKGEEQTLYSFAIREHLKAHHEVSLEYLKSRVGHRALLAICTSEPYSGVLAESVTSIALQLLSRTKP